jgi:hypothetical protein
MNDNNAANVWRDKAKDGWDIRELETLLRDCEEQPAWRDRADLAHAYYDGKQLTEEQKQDRRERTVSERPLNLIARVINGVLGTQAKARRDVRVDADDDSYQDVSEALSVRLKEAVRETRVAMSISNAYASMVKGGLGWVEVSRTTDPQEYQYRAQDVHRNEIYWDWRCKNLDISLYARWLCRGQWHDLDELQARLPEHAEILENLCGNWQAVIQDDWMDERWQSAYQSDRRFGVARSEWVDGGRRRIKLYEVWYRAPAEVVVFRTSPAERFRVFDEENELHVEAVSRGLVEVSRRTTRQVRRALFAGPYRLYDEPTKRTRFPYIPFIAFRDDADGTPYGLIEGMIEPQDGYNERRTRIEWMLKAQQLIIDEDAPSTAYNTIEDITATMMRPDMVAVMNPNRRNAAGMTFRNDLQLQQEQWQTMQDDKGLIQDVPGVYSTMLGNAPTGVTAGNAIASLVEQGEVALGELNDNLAFSEGLVYESLLQLIMDDLSAPDIPVTIGSGDGKRVVMLNTRDEQGRPVNVVKDAQVRTALAEIPQSPAYRQQQQQQLAQILQALGNNPQAAALLAPVYIESGTHPDRHRIADDLRRMSGLPAAGDKAGADAAAQQAQQQQQAAAQAQQAAAQADLAVKQARAQLDQARAQQVATETQLMPAELQIKAQQASASPEDDAIQAALAEAMQPVGAT